MPGHVSAQLCQHVLDRMPVNLVFSSNPEGREGPIGEELASVGVIGNVIGEFEQVGVGNCCIQPVIRKCLAEKLRREGLVQVGLSL